MELTILGSSSAGNCYVFQNENEALIVECGIKFTEVRKALNFNISKVVGALVTHEHCDHSKYVKVFIGSGIDVYASSGTIEAMGLSSHRLHPILSGDSFHVGNFIILTFSTKHDSKEPVGFLIYHKEMGTTLFATDTYYLPVKFYGLNNILIECNYRIDLLEKNIELGLIPAKLRDRTLQSHMSYDTCLNALLANDLTAVNNIVPIHLSDNNSNALEFKKGIQEATGKTVHVADSGMKILMNKTPF